MSSDTLTVTSRAFYERSKGKVAISIIVAAASLMLLGFCSVAGGNAAAENEYYSGKHADDHSKNAESDLAGGYGFASFVYILAFILLVSAAIYISPFFCGSNNEKKMIRAPQEIDTGYAAYSENQSSSAPPQV